MVNTNPLIAQSPNEVPLKEAPLIRVLAQMRFSDILSIEESSFVAPFQEAIREKYPILQREQAQGLIFGPQGVAPTKPKIIWRFADVSNNWRVSLTSDFIALDTVAYSSRSDFLEQLENVLAAFDMHIKPQIVQRFGLRYIDRLVKQDIKELSKLVRPELAGIVATFGEHVHQSISEVLFNLPEGDDQILARWGLLPAGTTTDPSAVEPIGEPSWVLDLDMSLSKQREFNVKALMNEAQRFAERLYIFFRWAVTDNFLQRFGGEP